jgi:predicted ATPase/signal transduction histidine kinase/GAF domain-containing protein
MELSEYALERLRGDGEFTLYRGHANQTGTPSILLLAPASTRPSPDTLKKIDHEYALRHELDAAWAVRPLALSERSEQVTLVLEDPGGVTLDEFLSGPMEIARFLTVAVGLATALAELHRRAWIHKDVKPSNVLVHCATGQVRLMGFGIASRLRREYQPFEAPEFIAGTLPYMAPEQTGRMNRSIDSRSDLYAFGVTLYEMLTGTRPFTASEPLEWVHCHIARIPVPPHERVPSAPSCISAIVMKLLAKTPEARYQTAAGVESDLRRCLAEWEARGRIVDFALGLHDAQDRLVIPETLYGRAREIETLLTAFDRVVAGGRPELVLVSGYSGIGKSAVVNELHKPLVPPRGLFASGKFDQHKRDIPYATLAQAFQSLIRTLLSKNEEELGKWRNALHEALDPNGQLMVALVPELKTVMGEQPPVPELPQEDAQRRFQLVFRRFVSVFARPEHPLALFLDDLQWVDAATLDLIEDLLTQSDVKHLLLIGAYRDNEVDSTHPLTRRLYAMRQAGALLQDMVLAPLTREDVQHLIADALHDEPEHARPLAELVHDKTTGNPFFANQFLFALFEEGLLSFDHVTGRWSWDLDRIHAKGYTDNVVDLMVRKLTRLLPETQNALQQLACLGNSAQFTMLGMVCQDSLEQLHAHLAEAVAAGLISRFKESYRFLHDRIHEAAYSLIAQERRAEAHLRIGVAMAAQTPPDKLEEGIFEIVNQLNRGSHLVTSIAERERLAELNLLAGRRAKVSTAYASAVTYLRAGRELLADETWNRNYDLAFSIEFLLAECELLSADIAGAENRLSVLAERTRTSHHNTLVTRLRVTLYTAQDRYRAMHVFLEYLRSHGTDWPTHPSEEDALREYRHIWSLLGDRQIEELIDLPVMTNRDVLDLMEVFAEVATLAAFIDANCLALVICRMVSLSLEHGNCDASTLAYVYVSMIAGPRFDNYEAGIRFGTLACNLLEQRGLHRYRARTYNAFGTVIVPWTRHIKTAREHQRRCFEAANRSGELSHASYSLSNLCTAVLATGEPLSAAQHEAETGLKFVTNIRFGLAADCISPQLGLIRTLRGLTSKFGSFDDDGFDEERLERHFASLPALALPECWYWIRKLQARFFAGDYLAAIEASSHAEALLWVSASFFEVAEYHFYSALSRAACVNSATAGDRQRHVDTLIAHQKQQEIWARHCPENFENRVALVGAELARIQGHVIEAEQLYEQAIRSAHTHGFVNNEAIAYEIAARFYAARGLHKFADAYLLEARYCYQRWGADGKVAQLNCLRPDLATELPAAPTSAILARTELLDLTTVIKVSEAVSGEMVLEPLIESLMRAAIEHAGAGRGLLIRPQGDQFLIQAEAATAGDAVTVYLRDASANAAALPESVVRYVMRTRHDVILDDASADNPFSADPYILDHRVRSILCLPLINQTNLTGILYLENNLAARVFTPSRITVLKVLASQAAISLENSRLYRNLEDRERAVRRSEAFLAEAQALSQTGSWGWNTATGDLFWSRETYRIFEFRSDVAPTLPMIVDVVHPDDRARFVHEVEMFGRDRTDFEHEYRLKLQDGSIKYVYAVGRAAVRGFPNLDFIGAIMDVTDRKRAEDALLKAQAELADVTRLTTMGELAASIAHEINQPLAAVVTNAQTCASLLSAQSPPWGEVKGAVSDIAEAGKRASDVIARIRLLLSKGVAEPSALSVNEVIGDVIALTRDTTRSKRITLETRLTLDVPPVLADRVQLQQVLVNLITNAADAMAEINDRPRTVTISSSCDDGRQVEVAVADAGVGIDPRHRDRIFDAFFTTKGDGMGMGLAICRGIVEAFGGRLWATSNPDCGTTFRFALPAAAAEGI